MAVLKFWDEGLKQWLPVAPGPKGDKGDKGDKGNTGNTGPANSLSVGNVATGSAAAAIRGTAPAQVLDLTIPTAGPNGVNTAALQDGAVTSAKIADGTIVSGDVAASTFAAHATVGNLLSANVASGTDTLGTTAGLSVRTNCTLASVTSYPYSGVRSVRMTPSSGSSSSSFVADAVAVSPGETLTAVARIACQASIAHEIMIIWFNSSMSELSLNVQQVTAGGWVPAALTAVVPASAAYAQVGVWRSASDETKLTFVDELGLWKGTGGQWAMPGTPIVGQSRIAVNNAVDLSGTGTPEGVVTAAPGSSWLQTDSTTDVKGWLRWIKATGTGNTGWVAEGALADTGPRNPAADLTNGWAVNAAGFTFLQRVGKVVHFCAYLTAASSTNEQAYTLPTGFRPKGHAESAWSRSGTGTPMGAVEIRGADGIVRLWGATTTAQIVMQASWITEDAWPASLPGVAA